MAAREPGAGTKVVTPLDAPLNVLPDAGALARAVADWLLATAIASEGRFSIALSGGSTPKRLYEILADAPFSDLFPWQRTHIFWGDERFVPPGDSLSNFRMAHEALLSKVPIPASNIHPVPTERLSPEAAATDYEAALAGYYGRATLEPQRPLFNVTLLGLGTDGHIASLFPGTAVLNERVRWVSTVLGAKAEARITLTYPALESSGQVAVLISGHDKQDVFAKLRHGDQALPASHLRPAGGLRLFADAAAAGS